MHVRAGINVNRARREAKALLAAARRGDPGALAELGRRNRPPVLADAQHAVARRHGFRSWVELLAVSDRGRQLREAARRGDDEAVYALLIDGADPNAADPHTGRTALHEAAVADQLDAVAQLATWVPVDHHRRDRTGRTAADLARPGSPAATVLNRVLGVGRTYQPLPDTHAGLETAVELTLIERISLLPGVERWPVGNGFGFRTGLDDNTRNGIVAGRATEGAIADALARLAGVPAQWHPAGDASPELAAMLTAAGARPERDAVFMHRTIDRPGTESPAVVRVTDPLRVVGVEVAEAGLLLAAGAEAFAAGGEGSVVTFTSGTTVHGVHLHVARPHRRRGLGRILVEHALHTAHQAGCTDAIVSPTAATVTFYERFGFQLERSAPGHWWYLPL